MGCACTWGEWYRACLRSRQRSLTLKIHYNVVTPHMGSKIGNDALSSIDELEAVGEGCQRGRNGDFQTSIPPWLISDAEEVNPGFDIFRYDHTILGENTCGKEC